MIKRLRRHWHVASMALLLAACSDNSAPTEAPATEVVAMTVLNAPRSRDMRYTARTQGEREVEVRARVSGILEHRYYHEGDRVEAGAKLFRIDPAPYRAALASAQGRLGIELAKLEEARKQHERTESLFGGGYVSNRARDQALADWNAAQSGVAAAQAELEQARLNLSYTDVRAPISGVTGLESRSEGSLIDATQDESSLLTTITQTDRLYIDFSMPEDEARALRAAWARGKVSVHLQAPGTDAPLGSAVIGFIDSRVDPDTGTVTVRATLENTAAHVSAGQFVVARLIGLTAPPGIYVPSGAISHGADGPYVWKIDAKDRALMQPVVLGDLVGNDVRIEKGLADHDRIVLEGILKLQPGAPVRAAPADKRQAADAP